MAKDSKPLQGLAETSIHTAMYQAKVEGLIQCPFCGRSYAKGTNGSLPAHGPVDNIVKPCGFQLELIK